MRIKKGAGIVQAQMPRRYQLWHGQDEPPGKMTELQAGPVTAYLDGMDLRYVSLGGRELVRRIYVAVRDQNWETIPALHSQVKSEVAADHFWISFQGRNQQGEIDFRWQGAMVGRPNGRISYEMNGAPEFDFLYNRIGICVLHPPDEAGRSFRAITPSGPTEGVLPDIIGPQRIVDGNKVGLFPPFTQLSIDLPGGAALHFDFTGDLFEMEDQRNWTDGSFKSYSTPLALPYPKPAQAGQEIRQSVTVSAADQLMLTGQEGEECTVRITLGESLGHGLPPIGFGMASHGRGLSAREVALLRSLAPAHLRLDLHVANPDWREDLARGVRACSKAGCPLELALFVADEGETQLEALAALLQTVPVARVLVFHEGEKSRSGAWMRLVQEKLGPALPNVPVAGGTNAFFTEINAARPEVAEMEGVAYSINPQVHAFDDASLAEALEPQATTVRSARAFSEGRSIFVGPVTLRPRFNPNATGPEAPLGSGRLPSQVDPRQMSLLGAAWTAGSIKYLAESGADAVTYYETTGWRGLMETETGSPAPELFPSSPGMVFPLYHVFRDVADREEAELVEAQSSRPLVAIGLALRRAGVMHILLANLTPQEQSVSLGPLGGGQVAVQRLNEATVRTAMFEPERYQAEWGRASIEQQELRLTVAPFETVRVRAS